VVLPKRWIHLYTTTRRHPGSVRVSQGQSYYSVVVVGSLHPATRERGPLAGGRLTRRRGASLRSKERGPGWNRDPVRAARRISARALKEIEYDDPLV
jgi:hypothetical protein